MPLSALKRGPASPNGMLLQDYTQHSSPDGLVASAGGGSAVTSPDRQRTSADGSSTSTPKRVSFQLPPRPTTSAAATAAGRLLQGGGGSGIGSNSPALRRPQHLAEASAAASVQALQLQHDMPLVFLPDADSPRHRLQPLTVPPLASCRRWPSNEALMATDEEIAGAVDMTDTPLSPSAYAGGSGGMPAGTGLAQAIWDLLPASAGSATPLATPWRADDAVAAADQPESAGLEPEEQPVEPVAAAAAAVGGDIPTATAPARPQAQAPGLVARLSCLLRRLLSAAGSSGSSIAEEVAAGSGGLGNAGSRSASYENLYIGRSGSSVISESDRVLEEDCTQAGPEQQQL